MDPAHQRQLRRQLEVRGLPGEASVANLSHLSAETSRKRSFSRMLHVGAVVQQKFL